MYTILFTGNSIASQGVNKEECILLERFTLWRPSQSNDPRYLLLDEPTANLDLSSEMLLMNILKARASSNVGILVILHDLNLASHFADKIAIMKDGEIKAFGKPEEIMKDDFLTSIYEVPIKVKYEPLRVYYY